MNTQEFIEYCNSHRVIRPAYECPLHDRLTGFVARAPRLIGLDDARYSTGEVFFTKRNSSDLVTPDNIVVTPGMVWIAEGKTGSPAGRKLESHQRKLVRDAENIALASGWEKFGLAFYYPAEFYLRVSHAFFDLARGSGRFLIPFETGKLWNERVFPLPKELAHVSENYNVVQMAG